MPIDKYLDFVQQIARQRNKEFFLDSGEGNDWEDPQSGWYVEKLSGWLIDAKDAAQFAQLLHTGGKEAAWRSNYQYCFVSWTRAETEHPCDAPVDIQFELVKQDS
jgi:hypothetical protein